MWDKFCRCSMWSKNQAEKRKKSNSGGLEEGEGGMLSDISQKQQKSGSGLAGVVS